MAEITIHKKIIIESSTEYGIYFTKIFTRYKVNNQLFSQLRLELENLCIVHNGVTSFDTNYDKAILLLDSFLDKNIHIILEFIYNMRKNGKSLTFKGLPQDFVDEILNFSDFITPLLTQTFEDRKQKERELTVAFKAFKGIVLKKTIKKALIIASWLVKWSSFLQAEDTFRPENLKAYKQGEIVLVDFGFNIGSEFGGRHYAVVLERNNNPRVGVILVAPISSYDPTKGQHPHRMNVDLGIGAIHNYSKGCQVVMNQIRYISKLRIEKPKTSFEEKIMIDKEKLNIVLARFAERVS